MAMHYSYHIYRFHVYKTRAHFAIISQELRTREDEVNFQAEVLNQREKALDAREMDILSRELKEMLTKSTPMPHKRGGKFSKTKLKVCAHHLHKCNPNSIASHSE